MRGLWSAIQLLRAMLGYTIDGRDNSPSLHHLVMLAPGFVVFIVHGSIYAGATSITEAAAMGVVAVWVLSIARGEFSWTLLRESLLRTFKSTGITAVWCGGVLSQISRPAGNFTAGYFSRLPTIYLLAGLAVFLVLLIPEVTRLFH